MAEQKEDRAKEDLTEEASPYRIEEYRQKGMVAQSRELSGLVVLLATSMALSLLAPRIGSEVIDFMQEVFSANLTTQLTMGSSEFISFYFKRAIQVLMTIGLPVCLLGFVAGVIGSVMQVGSVFSFDPLTPDFGKVDPLQGFKRLFSLKHVVDGLRVIAKMTIILVVAVLLIRSEVLLSPVHVGADPGYILLKLGGSTSSIFFTLLLIVSIFAGFDYWLQKSEYNKSLRMTKQEAKQEHREREGDPQIRARIRSVQREIARRRMMQSVKKADVIITNPTHIAIAIVYDVKTMGAPKVVAKGVDFVAQKIKEIAAAAGVPLVENVPLARTLHKTVKVGQAIPRALYQAVAEVLAYVYRLRKNNL